MPCRCARAATAGARVAVPGVPLAPAVVALHMAGPWPDSTLWLHDIAQLVSAWGARIDWSVVLERGPIEKARAARIDWRKIARDLRAPAMAIGSNPPSSTIQTIPILSQK